jgi:hypothetical protein
LNLTDIRTEIALALEQIDDLTTTPRVPSIGEVTPPHAFISDMAVRIADLSGNVDVVTELTVVVSKADDDTGWDTLSRLCDVGSGQSLIDIFSDDRTLNGTADGLTIGDITAMRGDYMIGEVAHLGFQLSFTVHV